MEFVNSSFWESQAASVSFETAQKSDIVRQLLERWLSQVNDKTAIEIGCVPGRYLSYLGQLGYTLYGIDIIEPALSKMKEWFKRESYKIGEIQYLRIEEYKPGLKFDLVCSFGFIEHFEDYIKCIRIHCELVGENGLLVITTPNFYGLGQKWLHQWLDNENLKRHNLNSMKPEIWRQIVVSQGFDVCYAGYFGYFSFWIEDRDERSVLKKLMAKIIIQSLPVTSRILPKNSKWFSPFCGIVAKRRVT